MSMVVIGSAAMSNVRRIWRYLSTKKAQESEQESQVLPSEDPGFLFLSLSALLCQPGAVIY